MESAQEEVTTSELHNAFIDDRLRDLHTSFPAKVEAFHPNPGGIPTVDCTPQLNRHLPDGLGSFIDEALPKLAAVPVAFPRGGGFFQSMPIAVGDFVLVTICQKNIAKWLATGNAGDPGDTETHTLDGAVAYAGIFPSTKPLQNVDATNAIFGSDTVPAARIEVTSTGLNLGASATHPVPLGDNLVSLLNAIAAGNATSAADPIGIILVPAMIAGHTAVVTAISSAVVALNSLTTKTV
jgi:hypothetical protein